MPTSPRRARRRGTPLASLCEAAQCSPRSKYPWGAHWVVRRSIAEASWPSAMTEGLSLSGGAEPRPYNRLPTLHFVLDLSFRGREAPVGIRPLFISTAALAATYLCRSAAKARFDNRPPPEGCFQRGRAAALPLWSLKDGGFSRGKEDRNFLPP